jgi:hypothetical protein
MAGPGTGRRTGSRALNTAVRAPTDATMACTRDRGTTGTPQKGNGTMTDNTDSALVATALRSGDRVEVRGNGHTHYSGYVEDTMPQLNIVWVRERRTGERRMLSTDECRIFRDEA